MKRTIRGTLFNIVSYLRSKEIPGVMGLCFVTKGSEVAVINLSRCFIRSRVVSRVNILILNFSPAPVARPTAPGVARESSRMFLFTDPNVFSAFALCSARKAPFLSEKLLAGRLSPADKVAAATIKQFHLPERLLIFFRRQCVNSRFRKMR